MFFSLEEGLNCWWSTANCFLSPIAVIDFSFNTAARVLVFRLNIAAHIGDRSSLFFVNDVVHFSCAVDELRVTRLYRLGINMQQISLLESVINKFFEIKTESFTVINDGPSCTGRDCVPIFSFNEEKHLD